MMGKYYNSLLNVVA